MSKALAAYQKQQQDAQKRAEAERQQMLGYIKQLQTYNAGLKPPTVENPYTDQWYQNAANQQGDERGRQLQASEAALAQQYQNLGRAVDPRVLAMLRNKVMQQGNADLSNLQVGAAGNSFNASVAQNNALQNYQQNQFGNQSSALQMFYNVLNNTQYGPDPNQLALIMQLGQQAALAPSSTGGSPSWNPSKYIYGGGSSTGSFSGGGVG